MSSTNFRIAKNTMMLYVRMILTMAVTLYTSRVVLNTLGVEDFGIYNVIGGAVVMFSFLNSAMAASAQRFLTFALGKGDLLRLKQVFSMSVSLHVIISIILLIFVETIGLWFINTKLNVPADRMVAANWVFQFSVLVSIVNIISVPYNAIIIAHEKMNIYALLSIVEVSLKLAVVLALQYFGQDKLIFYAVLIFFVTFINKCISVIYCIRQFKESKFIFFWEKRLFREMSSFAGWNLLGVFAGIGSNQGVNILLNIFFGPAVNAARAVSYQVMSAVNEVVYNFQLAVNPQITKSFAKDDNNQLMKLVIASSKFSHYLLLIFIIPIFIEANLVLAIWLKNVPQNTVIFTRLVLVDIIICSLSGPLQSMVQATGKVKIYQIVVSSILLLVLPISYIFLRFAFQPESVFIVAICLSCLALIVRLYIMNSFFNFNVNTFLGKVILPIIKVSVLSLPVPIIIYYSIDNVYLRFLAVSLSSFITTMTVILFFGLNLSEKLIAKDFFYRKILKKNIYQ